MLSAITLKLNKNVRLIFILSILAFTFLRLTIGGFNFSYFVVAGSDFATQIHNPNLIINQGQGYDGQFFYRYAHQPLSTEKTAYGITVDHPEYRIQRILYPATSWMLSLGGNKTLVPIWLVLTNALAFIGLFWICLKITQHYDTPKIYTLLPIFLFGGYMALARNTSELFEVFFFGLSIYALIKDKIVLYTLSILFAIFSRETSLIAIAPLTLFFTLKLIKNQGINIKSILKVILFTLPFISIVLWKYYIAITINPDKLVDGSQNLSLPILGIIEGAKANFNFNDTKSIFETIFWFSYFIWNVWFLIIVLKKIHFKTILSLSTESILHLAYVLWAFFTLILGPAIYIDDWGFVRIFTLWNFLGFIILIQSKKTINKYFIIYSAVLLAATLFRLIIRV